MPSSSDGITDGFAGGPWGNSGSSRGAVDCDVGADVRRGSTTGQRARGRLCAGARRNALAVNSRRLCALRAAGADHTGTHPTGGKPLRAQTVPGLKGDGLFRLHTPRPRS
eukprot:1667116-Rhodomonas_salina.1